MKLFFSMYGLKFSRSDEFKPFKPISKQLLNDVTISPMWQPFLEKFNVHKLEESHLVSEKWLNNLIKAECNLDY